MNTQTQTKTCARRRAHCKQMMGVTVTFQIHISNVNYILCKATTLHFYESIHRCKKEIHLVGLIGGVQHFAEVFHAVQTSQTTELRTMKVSSMKLRASLMKEGVPVVHTHSTKKVTLVPQTGA